MTSDIWSVCTGGGEPPYTELGGEVLRLVESQEQVATMELVDTLAEQDMLERLLDQSKPPYGVSVKGLHYLLATPFRYPPLKYGSRFGSRFEPSLFYGSRDVATALAESAYYRFIFWDGMVVPPPSGAYKTQHTLFGAEFMTTKGICLHSPPFDEYRAVFVDKRAYGPTQQLGLAMREAGVEAIEYLSARAPSRGINVALYTPGVFTHPRPVFQEGYVCETTPVAVTFITSAGERSLHCFGRADFTLDGVLPYPAS